MKHALPAAIYGKATPYRMRCGAEDGNPIALFLDDVTCPRCLALIEAEAREIAQRRADANVAAARNYLRGKAA